MRGDVLYYMDDEMTDLRRACGKLRDEVSPCSDSAHFAHGFW